MPGFHLARIPIDFFTDPVSEISQQNCFGQCSRVGKITGSRLSGLAGFDPFGMVADGIGNGDSRWRESGKLRFRQQKVAVVIG